MLARCGAKTGVLSEDARSRITLVEAELTRFQLGRTFQLAIAPFRPICHLTTVVEHLAFLKCAREHLVPDASLSDYVAALVYKNTSSYFRIEVLS